MSHQPRSRQSDGCVGEPKYRLTRYSLPNRRQAAAPKNYMKRLRRYQPRPITASAARALHDANRGER